MTLIEKGGTAINPINPNKSKSHQTKTGTGTEKVQVFATAGQDLGYFCVDCCNATWTHLSMPHKANIAPGIISNPPSSTNIQAIKFPVPLVHEFPSPSVPSPVFSFSSR